MKPETEKPSGRSATERFPKPAERRSAAGRDTLSRYSSEPSGRMKPNFLIIGLIAATFFASLIITIVIFSGSSRNSTSMVYLSEGSYGMIRDMESGTTMDLVGCKSGESAQDMLLFGNDGKSIYFLTRFNGTSGTLNRLDYTKIRMTSSRNEDQVENIGQDVAWMEPWGENGLLYGTADQILYYYNGTESIQIARSVSFWKTDEKGRILYAAGEKTLTLYGAALEDPDNRQKLVSGLSYEACRELFSPDDGNCVSFDHIPYLDKGGLYTIGFDREPTLIADGAVLNLPGGSGEEQYPSREFLYYVRTDKSLIRYDHLAGDKTAIKDGASRQPKEDDYRTAIYEWKMVTDVTAKEEDYPEVVTSCILPLAGLQGSTMEETRQLTDISYGRISTIASGFVAKYSALADEDGLIQVTDEVRADLERLADATGMRNWLLFCLTKEQTGTQLDEAAYEKAKRAYGAVSAREELRKELKRELPLYTVCSFHNGQVTILMQDVVLWQDDSKCGGPLLLTDKAMIDWISDRQLEDLAHVEPDIMEADWAGIVRNSGTIIRIPETALQDIGPGRVYLTDQRVYYSAEDGLLYSSEVKDGRAAAFIQLAEMATVCGLEGNRLYYTKDGFRTGDRSFADLYRDEKGKSVCLARELLVSLPCYLYEDGSLLGFTDISGSFDGETAYELTAFSKDGTAKYVADGVTAFARINTSDIIYLSEGDLYLFNGKNHSRLKNGVDQFWVNNRLKPVSTPDILWKD